MAKKSEYPFIRSVIDLGDFNDDEVNNEPSLTDPSQDEPIEALVARMMRGELVGSAMPQFDTDSDSPVEDVFQNQSAIVKDGFDLADAAVIEKRARKALKSLKKAPQPPAPPEAPKPPESAPKPLPDAK